MGPVQSGLNQIVQSVLRGKTFNKAKSYIDNINKNTKSLSEQWSDIVKKGKISKEDAEAFASANVTPEQQSTDMQYILSTELDSTFPPEGFDERMKAAEMAYKRAGNDNMAENASKRINQINRFAGIKEMLEGNRGEILG